MSDPWQLIRTPRLIRITGILFQLPTGLSNGGLLVFASQATEVGDFNPVINFEELIQNRLTPTRT